MNTLTMTYGFIDLLKDQNYEKNTKDGSNDFLSNFKSLFKVKNDAPVDYNFMDLLKDRGQVPVIEEEENSIILEIENGLSTVAGFLEETTVDYDFLDLLKDKGYGFVEAPFAANDNEVILRDVS